MPCFPGGSQSLCQIPRLGNLLCVLKLLQKCENVFGIIILQCVGHLLGSSIVELMVTLIKRSYVTRLPGVLQPETLSPQPTSAESCLPRRHSKAGLAHSLVEAVAPFPGSWCTQAFVCALRASLKGMRFDFKCDCSPPTILLGLLLCSWMQGIFFFLLGSNILLLMVAQQLVAISVCSHRRR